jgi:hypothetical protein
MFSNAAGYKRIPFPSFLFFAPSLLLHHFFFFIDNTTTPERLTLYTTVLIDERRVTHLLLTTLSIFVLTWLTFAFCIIAPFLKRSNRMALWHQNWMVMGLD